MRLNQLIEFSELLMVIYYTILYIAMIVLNIELVRGVFRVSRYAFILKVSVFMLKNSFLLNLSFLSYK